jgi:hypothetical protein
MERRPSLRRLDSRLAAAAVLLLALVAGAGAEDTGPRYNVLLFILDDLPFAALPYHNPPIDYAEEVPHNDSARALRSGTQNRLEARLLAAPDGTANAGVPGTFRPPLDHTPSAASADGSSPWREYRVCAIDALLDGSCDPGFRYVPLERCSEPDPPPECAHPDFASERAEDPGRQARPHRDHDAAAPPEGARRLPDRADRQMARDDARARQRPRDAPR